MPGVAITFTSENLRAWEQVFEENPGFAKLREILVAYARREGGLTLQFWRLKLGPYFGEPRLMSFDVVAKHLDVPVSRLALVAERTWDAIRPELEASTEWQQQRTKLPQGQGVDKL